MSLIPNSFCETLYFKINIKGEMHRQIQSSWLWQCQWLATTQNGDNHAWLNTTKATGIHINGSVIKIGFIEITYLSTVIILSSFDIAIDEQDAAKLMKFPHVVKLLTLMQEKGLHKSREKKQLPINCRLPIWYILVLFKPIMCLYQIPYDTFDLYL